jgi:hypothetical protein
MGGRGGRGGGGKPVSNARLLLQRSAHEAGLDDSNLRALHDITSTGLYTDLQWHSSGRGLWVPEEEPENIPSALPVAISGGTEGGTGTETGGGDGGSDVKAEQPEAQQQQQQQQAKQQAQAAPQIPETNRTMTCINAPATTVLAKTKRLPTVTYMTNKQRELIAKWQASGHYVRPSQQVDVIRYATYYKSNRVARSVVQAVLNSMRAGTTAGTVGAGTAGAGTTTSSSSSSNTNFNNKLAMDEQYIPSELIQSGTTVGGRLKSIPGKKSARELDRLAQEESTNPGIAAAAAAARAEDGEGDEFDNDVLEEPAEEEDGEDYTTNHYASDDDDGGGDDDGGEPTF